jgi:hypothetical protein
MDTFFEGPRIWFSIIGIPFDTMAVGVCIQLEFAHNPGF